MIRRSAFAVLAVLAYSLGEGPVHADVLDLALDVPTIVFNNNGQTTYTASGGNLTVTGTPLAVRFSANGPPRTIQSSGNFGVRTVNIGIRVNPLNGALVGGIAGADLIVRGAVDADGNNTIDYSGILLQGEITAFGSRDVVGFADEFDFRFAITGGSMAGFVGARSIGVTVVSEASSFNGSFAVDFGGGAKGNIGPDGCICVVVIDEDTIDNGIQSIEDAAASHNVTPDFLVNDDIPTEVGNPCLRWCSLFPGDIVKLPGGQVDDEGVFALPPNTPWSLASFVAGTVPQNQLDEIEDVMPLRNQDLYRLIGRTCVAVVYDSDISMNYLPIKANLQGARYGLFYFTLLDVIVPSTIPESGSSSSLYELLVRVESCELQNACIGNVNIVIRDHEPDVATLKEARWCNNVLFVRANSDFAPTAAVTLSIDGFIFEAPMTFFNSNEYRFTLNTNTNLIGRRISVQTDEGGANHGFINGCNLLAPRRGSKADRPPLDLASPD